MSRAKYKRVLGRLIGHDDHKLDEDWRDNDEKRICEGSACYKGLCPDCAVVVRVNKLYPKRSSWPYRLWCGACAHEAD